jgi:hypothetical protein
MDRSFPFNEGVDDLALICSTRDTQCPSGDAKAHVQREVASGMQLGLPLEHIDERLVVFIDAKARVSAMGFPHGNEFIVLERHPGNRARCVTIPGPIVSIGSWNMCRAICTVNGVDGWGSPDADGQPTSVLSLLREKQSFEHHMAM